MFKTHRRPVHFNACVNSRKTVVNVTLPCLVHKRTVVFFFTYFYGVRKYFDIIPRFCIEALVLTQVRFPYGIRKYRNLVQT